MSEYWIEVKGHHRYRVSTMGRVKCLDWKRTGKEKICKLSVNSRGYLQVRIDGVLKTVHRLVLESFLPIPNQEHNQEHKPEIDHINTIKTDNRIENLRFCNHSENSKNPLTRKHMSENSSRLGKFGAENPSSIPIVQLTIDGQFIRKWPAAREVERELGINNRYISSCCRGRQKTAGGFKWVYASDFQKVRKRSISQIKPLF